MKPDKPKDLEESWLRKMADRLPRSGSRLPATEGPEDEEETDVDDSSGVTPRKLKKKRKMDDGCTWPVLIFFALAAFGAWKLLQSLFG